MKRRFVRQNLLSTAFATAAFAAPNLARAFAQSLGHYGSPLPRFYDALAHSIADSGLPRPWFSRQRDRRARSMLPAPWTSTGRSINLDRYVPIQYSLYAWSEISVRHFRLARMERRHVVNQEADFCHCLQGWPLHCFRRRSAYRTSDRHKCRRRFSAMAGRRGLRGAGKVRAMPMRPLP